LSDLISWAELTQTRLFREVLVAVGGQYMMTVPLADPASGRLICFVVNRPDRDFADQELDFLRRLQPALVALYRRLSMPAGDTARPDLLTAMTDPLGKTTTYSYDTAGDLTAATTPEGRKTTHTHTPTTPSVGS